MSVHSHKGVRTGSEKTESINVAVRQRLYMEVRMYEGLGCINRASGVVVAERAQKTRTIVAKNCTVTISFAVLAKPASRVVPHDVHVEAGHSRPHTDQ